MKKEYGGGGRLDGGWRCQEFDAGEEAERRRKRGEGEKRRWRSLGEGGSEDEEVEGRARAARRSQIHDQDAYAYDLISPSERQLSRTRRRFIPGKIPNQHLVPGAVVVPMNGLY